MDKDRIAGLMLLFAMFAVFFYLVFYQGQKPDEIRWVCRSQSSEVPGALSFDELEAGAQAFVLEQWEQEGKLFKLIGDEYERYTNLIANQSHRIDSQQELVLARLEEILEYQPVWSNPKTKYYSCFIDTYRPLTP